MDAGGSGLWWMGMQASKKEGRKECWLGNHSGAEREAGRSEVSGGLGGERLDAAGVTVFAEDVSIQRVAALVVPLRKQRATVLQETQAQS